MSQSVKPITNARQAFLELRRDVPSDLRQGIIDALREAGRVVAPSAVIDAEWRLWGWRLVQDRPVPRALPDLHAYRVELGLEPPTVLHPLESRRLHGQLRLRETHYFDDKGKVLPILCHAGTLFSLFTRDREWAESEAQTIAQAGYQGVRVWMWLSGDYWVRLGRTVGPSTWERQVPAFCDMLQRNDLRLLCSLGDMPRAESPDRWPGTMRRLAGLLKPFAPLTIGVDAGNEAWNQTSWTALEMRPALHEFLKVYGVHLRSLTDSPEDDLSKYHTALATVTDVHNYRAGRMPDKIRHIFSMGWEGHPPRKLGILSEPWGAPTTQQGGLVSVTEHPDEIDDEAVGLQTAQGLIFGWAFTFMSSAGVSIRKRGEFETQPGFRSAPAVAEALPADVMTWRTWTHGGDSQRGKRALVADSRDNGLRCDHAYGPDGQVAIVCYGDKDRTTRPNVERGLSGRWLDCKTGEYGPPRIAVAGSRLAMPPARHGAVFVGKLT